MNPQEIKQIVETALTEQSKIIIGEIDKRFEGNNKMLLAEMDKRFEENNKTLIGEMDEQFIAYDAKMDKRFEENNKTLIGEMDKRFAENDMKMEKYFASVADDIGDIRDEMVTKEEFEKLTDIATATANKVGGIHNRIDNEMFARKDFEYRVRQVLPNLPEAIQLSPVAK